MFQAEFILAAAAAAKHRRAGDLLSIRLLSLSLIMFITEEPASPPSFILDDYSFAALQLTFLAF